MPRGVVTPGFNFENMPRQNSALLQQIFEGIMAMLNLEEETWSELLGLVGPERIRIKLTDLSGSLWSVREGVKSVFSKYYHKGSKPPPLTLIRF